MLFKLYKGLKVGLCKPCCEFCPSGCVSLCPALSRPGVLKCRRAPGTESFCFTACDLCLSAYLCSVERKVLWLFSISNVLFMFSDQHLGFVVVSFRWRQQIKIFTLFFNLDTFSFLHPLYSNGDITKFYITKNTLAQISVVPRVLGSISPGSKEIWMPFNLIVQHGWTWHTTLGC